MVRRAQDEEAEAADLEDGLCLGSGRSWKGDYYHAKVSRSLQLQSLLRTLLQL